MLERETSIQQMVALAVAAFAVMGVQTVPPVEKPPKALTARYEHTQRLTPAAPRKIVSAAEPVLDPEGRIPLLVDFLRPLACGAELVATVRFKPEAHPVVNDEETFVFTQVTARVEEVIRTNRPDVITGSIVQAWRPGGRVNRGPVTFAALDEAYLPVEPGADYLVFLDLTPNGYVFAPRGTYALQQTRVVAASKEPIPANLSDYVPQTFLGEVRSAAAGCPASPEVAQ